MINIQRLFETIILSTVFGQIVVPMSQFGSAIHYYEYETHKTHFKLKTYE